MALSSFPSPVRRGSWIATAAVLAALCPAAAIPAPPGPSDIQTAVEKARDYLITQQREDGSWETISGDDRHRTRDDRGGPTSLVMLALANAGVPAEHPAMRRALTWLRQQEPDKTYDVALQTMILAMLAPEADRAILERNVEWLEQAQVKQGPGSGSWTYGQSNGVGVGDPSNSQFAVLGLHEASRAGVAVRDGTWVRAQQYWVACHNSDGSWSYQSLIKQPGSGSMTCAGIASIWITSEHIGTPDARAVRDSVTCCVGGSPHRELEKGLTWLGKRFSVQQNPGTGETWLYYYLYGLERVGRFTARRYIGDHDWYLEGAKMLTATQDRLSGKFVGKRVEDPIVATSFALLFLAKGRRPVIVAKSSHAPAADWNRHGHDIAHLVDYVETRWKKDYPAGLSWHVLDTTSAGQADLQQAPVLWISGKSNFDLGHDAGRRLRGYIDNGGFVFAEACCPQSEGFDERLRQLVADIFPEPEYRLHLLPPEHPAWHAEQVVPPELHRPLMGIDYGCRTCLIYAPPTDLADPNSAMPSLSCLWELGGRSRSALPAGVAREVEAALAIGTNVLAYATNRELKSKDAFFGITPQEDRRADPFVRGQLAIGKLRHSGMCDAAPAALANILRAAARETGVRVDDTPALIDPADDALFNYHLVFMHGRQGFAFDQPRRERIAKFLDRGGTLLADSVCAADGFTKAFRDEIAAILPDQRLEEIPSDDPLFTAADYGGFDIRQVTLREPSGGDGPMGFRKRQIPPKLEGVRIGDRWGVIFSPYDLSCALEKQNSMECRGYGREDAEKIALNVLLYSLNH